MAREIPSYRNFFFFLLFILLVDGQNCPAQPCVQAAVTLNLGPANGKDSCSGLFCCFGQKVVQTFEDPFALQYPDWGIGSFLYGNACKIIKKIRGRYC